MKVRYLVRSGMNGRPETVLQFSYGSSGNDEVWTDVPICYTEEVMNDHHDKWPDDYKIENVKYLDNIVDNYEVS